MTVEQPAVESDPILGPEEGGGPPVGTPWTLVVEGEETWEADLEHAAPLPRVGERIEFIGEDGRRHEYRVVDVVHTIQSSADERPRVRDETNLPNSVVTDGSDDAPPRSLRAGLPKVVVRADS